MGYRWGIDGESFVVQGWISETSPWEEKDLMVGENEHSRRAKKCWGIFNERAVVQYYVYYNGGIGCRQRQWRELNCFSLAY